MPQTFEPLAQRLSTADDRVDLGAGQGGSNEDHEFHGYRMPI